MIKELFVQYLFIGKMIGYYVIFIVYKVLFDEIRYAERGKHASGVGRW